MEEFETTNPVEGDALPMTEVDNDMNASDQGTASIPAWMVEEDSEPAESEDAFDDSGDEDEEPDEDRYEEIERDGKTAKIPAWLKPELMMQADYTRKTQELAEARRAFEAEREVVQQVTRAEFAAHANLATIDRQIDQYAKVDWNAFNQSDPAGAQKAFTQFQLLQNARRETVGYIGTLQQERTTAADRERTNRYEKGMIELARELPDWTPDTADKLLHFAQQRYGFSAEDLEGIDDARAVKVLHAACQWEEHQARQRQAQRHAAAQGVRPAAKVGGAAPKSGLDDRLSTEEWVRRRNGKLRRRG